MAIDLEGVVGGDKILYTPQVKKNKQTATSRARRSGSRRALSGFFSDFACELDIFDTTVRFPSWVYGYREELLGKLSPELRRVCRWLKGHGLRFKIKWPVEIGGKWKFADVFFPGKGTVLMLTNAMALGCRPHWMLSDRAEFFKGRYRVIEVETLSELEMRYEVARAKSVEAVAAF